MWWEWLIFIALFVIIPFSIGYFKLKITKGKNLTKEQNEQANINVCKYTLFYLLCDLFYMSFIIDSLLLKYVFGGLIMIIIFYNLSGAHITENSVLKFGLIQDFIVGIGLSIYLIYIIPNKELQNIILPIIAAVYGGLLTLTGVSWTIRKGEEQRKKDREQLEQDRKEEERKKYIPYCKYINSAKPESIIRIEDNFPNINLSIKEEREKLEKNTYYNIQFDDFNIKNISRNNIQIEGICIDDYIYNVENNKIIEKDSVVCIKLSNCGRNVASWKLDNVEIMVSDLQGNKYLINAIIERYFPNSTVFMSFVSEYDGVEYKSCDINYRVTDLELPKLIKEETKDCQFLGEK